MHWISAAYADQTHSRAPWNSARPGAPRTSAFVTQLPMCGLKFLSFAELGDAVAEQVTGQRADDELVDEPAGRDDQNGEKEQRPVHALPACS